MHEGEFKELLYILVGEIRNFRLVSLFISFDVVGDMEKGMKVVGLVLGRLFVLKNKVFLLKMVVLLMVVSFGLLMELLYTVVPLNSYDLLLMMFTDCMICLVEAEIQVKSFKKPGIARDTTISAMRSETCHLMIFIKKTLTKRPNYSGSQDLTR